MQGAAVSAATATAVAASEGAAAYGVGMAQPQPPHGVTGVLLAFAHDGTAVYNHTPPPMYETPAPVRGNGEHKRKRGRPRKYAVTTDLPLAVVPPSPPESAPAAAAAVQSPAAPTLPPGFSSGLAACEPNQALPASEHVLPHKKRGRPPGSGNKLQPRPWQKKTMMSPASGGIGLKPNVITVQVGEDVVSKVMSFSQNGWAVCVLSANGAVSNVTLCQAGSSGATVNYVGHFELLSLSGSYLLSESDGLSSRTGGLSVSLAGPDGRVLGGGVAGPLNAASPVQIVIGSFVADVKKGPKLAVPGGAPFLSVSTPPSRGTPSGSSGGAGSPQNQSASGPFNTSNQQALADFPWR